MKKVRILLVGIGGYGEVYIKAMLPSPINKDCKLVAVVDPFIQKSSYKEELDNKNIPTFEDLDSFFNSEIPVDLAVVSSPIHTHYDYVNKCFDHGVNVLCEKPVTVSIERMEELIKREKETGLFCAVGYQLCFSKDVLELKKDVLKGLFGKPKRFKALRMMRRGDKYYSRTSWAGKLKVGNELILDSPVSNACAHQIQVMLFLLGSTMEETARIKSVEGRLEKARPSIENFDAAALKINTDKGVSLFYYTAHCLDEKKVGPLCHFEFENGYIESEDDNFEFHFNDGSVKKYDMDKGDKLEKLNSSIYALLNKKRPEVTLKSSIEHIRAVILASLLPVYQRCDATRKEEDGDGYYAIENLKNLYLKNYEEWKTE